MVKGLRRGVNERQAGFGLKRSSGFGPGRAARVPVGRNGLAPQIYRPRRKQFAWKVFLSPNTFAAG